MLKVNIVFLALLQIVNMASPLVVTAYTARVLGLDNFGMAALIQIVMQYASIVTNWGFDISATRIVSNTIDKNNLSIVFSKVWFAQWFLTLPIAFILLIWSFLLDENNIYLPAIGFLYVLGSVLLPSWLLRGLNKIKIMTSVQMATKIAAMPLYFLFVNSKEDLWVVVLLNSAPAFISGLIVFCWVLRSNILSYVRPSICFVFTELNIGRSIFFSRVLVSVYTIMTPLILGAVCGTASVGIFNIAEKIKMACIAIFSPVMQAIYPKMSKLFLENRSLALSMIKKVSIVMLLVAICQFAILFFYSEDVVGVVAGGNFSQASEVLKVISLVPILVVVSNVCGFQIILPLGGDAKFLVIYKFAAGASIILMWPLIYLYDYVGAGYVVLIAEIISATGMFVYAKKMLDS